MIITVVERNYNLPEDYRDRYIGSPCISWGEARELAMAHMYEVEDVAEFHMDYTDHGRKYTAIHRETGEILREYFLTVATMY